MICKMVEIRDSGTFIPALAVQLGSENEDGRKVFRSDDEREVTRWLLERAGFGPEHGDQRRYVALVKFVGGEPVEAHIDPFAWGLNPRTYHVAHQWIERHFDEIEVGRPGGRRRTHPRSQGRAEDEREVPMTFHRWWGRLLAEFLAAVLFLLWLRLVVG